MRELRFDPWSGEYREQLPIAKRVYEHQEIDALETLADDIYEYLMKQWYKHLTGREYLGGMEALGEYLGERLNKEDWQEFEGQHRKLFLSALPTFAEYPFAQPEPKRPIPYKQMEPYLAEIGGAQYADVLREM